MSQQEFAGQLRRLVDRSGLSVAALADRTGYGTASWERYLDGRLLAPEEAVVALAELTGADTAHLTATRERAAREAVPLSGAPTPSVRPPHPVDPAPRWREVTVFVAGVVGALLVLTAAVLLTDLGGGGRDGGDGSAVAVPSLSPPPASPPAPSPAASPSRTPALSLPAGVKCHGERCAGQDPEIMGCGGQFARTVADALVGTTLVEVRYSRTCGAAWARTSGAAPGDTVRITPSGRSDIADGTGAAYTRMIATRDGTDVTACVTLAASGTTECAAP